ncbi:unnamed protein product [Auanema sp. JU1783]|nr:unnamed protein product [Auanema sp. JU1783]
MMNTESTSEPRVFRPDDLIWAKMKGFPPWPAKVISSGEDIPPGRIPVMFFGTRETAFMKPSDLSDYMTFRQQHEVSRKHKGFNEGIHEIRVAAMLEAPDYKDPLFFPNLDSGKSPSPMPTQPGQRRQSGRMLSDAFLTGYENKKSNSASTVSRSRASSTASALKQLKKEIFRRRLDSESSNGSRRNKMISGLEKIQSTDFYAQLGNLDDFPLIGDDHLGADDARSTRSKRSRGSSKVFEEYILGSRTRHRSGSISENRGTRSRLISGVSDFFDDLLFPTASIAQAASGEIMHVLDDFPSESSEGRPGTPEAPAPLPRPNEFCKDCGCECTLVGLKWRCTSKYCLKWNGIAEPYNRPSTSIAPPVDFPVEVKEETPDDSPKREKSVKERIREDFNRFDKQIASTVTNVESPKHDSSSPDRSRSPKKAVEVQPTITKRATGRPKQYKVESTPPINHNGLRSCTFCNGQVRPQMCGGNKHRWRCVDKKCRKWYGWVKSSDEIPRDLGRKGRFSNVLEKARRRERLRSHNSTSSAQMAEAASISSAGEAAAAAAGLDTASLMSDDRQSGRIGSIAKELSARAGDDQPRKKGRPPKQTGIKIKLKGKDKKDGKRKATESEQRVKRKYTKRKDADVTKEEEKPSRPVSPLTPRELRYRPCAMEKRGRWWISEKRKIDVSPEREFQTETADSAAAFRILSHAFRAAAVTRADEPGTVNGSLDLMMDSLLGCMAPLLSLLGRLPNTRPDPQVLQQLWNASAVHLPMFQ